MPHKTELLNTAPPPDPRLAISARVLSTPEAARYCGSSPSSFEKMRLVGGGPKFIDITPRRIGYLVQDLDAWLDAKTRRASTSEREAA